jgi:hypothetical protein
MLEIYFSDLNEEGKKKVLDFFKIKEKEGNFEFVPLFILEDIEEEENFHA